MKEDRISQLPDDLISQILSHLPTKDAVQTSVLSTRWTSLWLWLPRLELSSWNIPDYNAMRSSGDRFFDSNRVTSIDVLKLSIVSGEYRNIVNDVSYLTSWIAAAIKRRIQHLEVKREPYNSTYLYEIPLSLYNCDRLVSLKLERAALASAEFVSLPCLKTMHLRNNRFPNETTFEALVSCCPVLEELEIFDFFDLLKVYRVHSQSLKRFAFRRLRSKKFYFVPGLVIDAPRLCGLEILDRVSNIWNIIITNSLGSIAKLHITLSFGLGVDNEESDSSWSSRIRSFLSKISRVMDMTISAETFKVIHQYSKLEPLPPFGYMTRLCLRLRTSEVKWLPTFLESCPNLKSLVLERDDSMLRGSEHLPCEEMNQISFASVPECLRSSLEFVVFEFLGAVADFKLGKYFLENSAVLKKLTLLSYSYNATKAELFKKFLRLPRRSHKCEVVTI
ncbi:hypothetical protein CARUB_v10025437mg [Capsella rubella]|uniref:F-box domain-containing protein n=2 Tax=Capsella rubella TaxID=81985 RepID=R0HYK3_9BRAS|nr:putative FBD-associated F-box protein At5g53635 isoform X2 [Capsella rubella]EOA29168.1 hypothetical protein CARUB_v10025437mg [Capsella rubella]